MAQGRSQVACATQTIFRWNRPEEIGMRRGKIAIAVIAVISVPIFLFFAPVYYKAPVCWGHPCSPRYVSPIYQWMPPRIEGGNYVQYGAVYTTPTPYTSPAIPASCYFNATGRCTPRPFYFVNFGDNQWNLTL